jgi:predicted nucleotidyltransferase
MNVVGLIVEYNPLHNGHRYHFEQAMSISHADACVIVMSGNFLQRGEPAIVDKWARAQMALEMGVDLIFELPYVYSTQHAKWFAFGAVAILNQLPFVTHLCFGSESGNLDELSRLAEVLVNEPESVKQLLQRKMKDGWSYPKAYSYALLTLFGQNNDDLAETVKQPNNILGLYYLSALKRLKSSIQPITIKRVKAHYHQTTISDTQIASATSIRHALFGQSVPQWEAIRAYVPPYTLKILEKEYILGRGLINWERFYPYLTHLFLSQSTEQLNQLYEMEEGIEHRIKKYILSAASVSQLIKQVKTKRYTQNRIQRMLVHALTQCRKESIRALNLEQGPTYLRLLGYSSRGKMLLNQYKKSINIPLIASIRKDHPSMLDWDLKAARIYSLGFQPEKRLQEMNREIAQPPLKRST